MTPLTSTISAQSESHPVHDWPTKDLIRLWPWLLPTLLLLSISCHGFDDLRIAMASGFIAVGSVWMTFLIARQLWGYQKAHATATGFMLVLGAFFLVFPPMPDMTLSFGILAATAALVHRRTWLFVSVVTLTLCWHGLNALLMPLSGLLGWWLANSLRNDLLRSRHARLRARHGLLFGWLLPLPFLFVHQASTLHLLALALFSALVIALYPSLAFTRRLWKIGPAMPGTKTLCIAGVPGKACEERCATPAAPH